MKTTYPTYVIDIDAARIAASIARNSSHCMIAEAVRDQVPNSTHVSVDVATIRWSDTKRDARYIFLTPGHAQQAIIAFDQGLPVVPFKIRLRVPAQIVPMRHGEHDRWPDKAPRKRSARSKATVVNAPGSMQPVVVGGHAIPNMATTRRWGVKSFKG